MRYVYFRRLHEWELVDLHTINNFPFIAIISTLLCPLDCVIHVSFRMLQRAG